MGCCLPPEGRVRLGISLKSILCNITGTVPNGVYDLANVQLLSSKIVTDYVVIFDTTQSGLHKDGPDGWISSMMP